MCGQLKLGPPSFHMSPFQDILQASESLHATNFFMVWAGLKTCRPGGREARLLRVSSSALRWRCLGSVGGPRKEGRPQG